MSHDIDAINILIVAVFKIIFYIKIFINDIFLFLKNYF